MTDANDGYLDLHLGLVRPVRSQAQHLPARFGQLPTNLMSATQPLQDMDETLGPIGRPD